ncbi:MAG: hypothetical protein PHX83_12020 [Acidobacteriia bacterium]|nr:hypothetical protein [Terriglobia bacterium]
MPYHDELPSTISTALSNSTGAKYYVEVIYDPEGQNIVLNGSHDIISMSPISNVLDLDPEWIHRPTIPDISITFGDPDDYFNPLSTSSPFHSVVGEFDRLIPDGSTNLYIVGKTFVTFAADEVLVINDGDKTEEVTVASFTAADGSSTFYHTIAIDTATTYGYTKGTWIYPKSVVNKDIIIRLHVEGSAERINLFRGKVLALPQCSNGKAVLNVVDVKKYHLDQVLRGAETGDSDKLKRVDTTGTIADTVIWNDGSEGTLDRAKVAVLSNAKLGEWTVEFYQEESVVVGEDFTDNFDSAVDYRWLPLTATRWTNGALGGRTCWYINTSAYGALDYNRLGELALVTGIEYYNFEFTCQAMINEALSGGYAFALVFGYEDANNYYYVNVNNNSGNPQIELWNVVSGIGSLISSWAASAYLDDTDWHEFTIQRLDGVITMWHDSVQVFQVTDTTHGAGLCGMGSRDDSAGFDDVSITSLGSQGFKLYGPDVIEGVKGRINLYAVKTYGNVKYQSYAITPRKVLADNDYLYIADSTDAVDIFDIHEKENPVAISRISGTGSPNYLDNPIHLAIKGDYLFVGTQDDDCVTILDVTDRFNPAYQTRITTPSGAVSASTAPNPFVLGENLYVVWALAAGSGLYVYSLADPENPSATGNIALTTPNHNCLFVLGDYAYCVDADTFKIIDISNPAAPSLTGSCTAAPDYLTAAKDLYVDGDYAYLVDTTNHALLVIDITDKANPVKEGALAGSGSANYLGGAYAVVKRDSYCYVAAFNDDSLTVVDVSTPASPATVDHLASDGSPNYLDGAIHLALYGDYAYVLGASDYSLGVFRISTSDSQQVGQESVRIPFSAFGGTPVVYDMCKFSTCINFENQNVVSALYDLYVNHAGIDNKYLDCSSYFGAKTIGTLNESFTAGDTTIRVAVNVPAYIKAAEVLTITEGTTTEDVTVSTGVAATAKYPPYITLVVSALANSYTKAATVTWKQRAAYDADFTWDAEYHYCDIMNYDITFSLDRAQTILQAIEEIVKHLDGYVWTDNWGVDKLHSFRPHNPASITAAHWYDTNITFPVPTITTIEPYNEFVVRYGYDYLNSEYMYEYVWPPSDEKNKSYIKHGVKRTKYIGLPGCWVESYAASVAQHRYWMWNDGITCFKYSLSLLEILTQPGDWVEFVLEKPTISAIAEVYGIQSLNLVGGVNFEVLSYCINNMQNWFLLNASGLNGYDVIW